MKSTVDEIRKRFDNDVERFSNLETGQTAAVDAALCMDLVAEAASVVTPHARSILDIGCGAGNYTLKLQERLPIPNPEVVLLDLSRPMLDRAEQRVREMAVGSVTTVQSDIREAELGDQRFDVVVAAMVLHHLRSIEEWEAVLKKIYCSMKPGGTFWIVDIVIHEQEQVHRAMWRRYGRYLKELKDEDYRDQVLAYIEKEDSPIHLLSILERLWAAGFGGIDVLHKNNCYVALGGVRLG